LSEGATRLQRVIATWHERTGLDRLPAHLEATYGGPVAAVRPMPGGLLFRVDRPDGRPWVARVFPSARPIERAHGDAEILRFLEGEGFPAERLAHPEPVSILDGQGVLVTELVEGSMLSGASEGVFRALGDLLGRLHALPTAGGALERDAGCLHIWSVTDGGLRDALDAAASWLAEAEDLVPPGGRADYESLLGTIAGIDVGEGLPRALMHPDPVHRNVIAEPDGRLVFIDWTGAGSGPRIASLGWLLLLAVRESRWNPRSPNVDAVLAGYRERVQLTSDELDRLPAAIPIPPLVHDCMTFCRGRTTLDEVTGGFAVMSRIAGAVTARARAAYG